MPSDGKSPAFRFYPSDFLSDAKVRAMDLEAVGAYLMLICHAWIEGSIPSDVPALARLVGVAPKQFVPIWKQVEPCWQGNGDGRLTQKRLEEERKKQIDRRERQIENGRLGGRPRKATGLVSETQTEPMGYFWETQTEPNTKPVRTRFSFSFSFSLSDYLASLDAQREVLGVAFPAPGVSFAAWFVARGLIAKAIPPDRALDFDATVFREAQSGDGAALVASYAPADLEARTARFFAAVKSRKFRMPASIASLRKAIDWDDVVGREPIAPTDLAARRRANDRSVDGMPVTIPADQRR